MEELWHIISSSGTQSACNGRNPGLRKTLSDNLSFFGELKKLVLLEDEHALETQQMMTHSMARFHIVGIRT